MNLALGALLIILFLLPALTFRIGISIPIQRKKGEAQTTNDMVSRNVSKTLSRLNFSETLFLFSIVPVALHLFSLLLISLSGFHVDYNLLLNLFASKANVLSGAAGEVFHHQLIVFLCYTLIEVVGAFFLGWFLIKILGRQRWILKMLMGNDAWFKLFTGTSLTPAQRQDLANVLVEVMVATKEATVIYSGFLERYETMDNSDGLAYITLNSAFRRDLRKAQLVTKGEEEAIITANRYDIAYGDIIPVPGHHFTISGKEIINLSVTYMEEAIEEITGDKILVPIEC
jgi:hypothetical protein